MIFRLNGMLKKVDNMKNITSYQKKIYSFNHINKSKTRRFNEIIKFLKNKRIKKALDVGCGPESILLNLNINEKVVMDLQEKIDNKDVRYIQKDVSNGIPEKNFDVIMAFELIEHLLDTDKFLEDCYNSLNQEGYLILSMPNLISLKIILSLIFNKQPLLVTYYNDDIGHIRHYTPNALKKQLEKHNFKIIKLYSKYYASKNPLATVLEKIIPLRNSCLLCIAKKKLK